MYPRKFEDLTEAFRHLPGVGAKTAERYAFAAMSWDKQTQENFIQAVSGMKDMKLCKTCGNIADDDLCVYCKASDRNPKIICVVQNAKDIQAIENTGSFKGLYHVLNGGINTQKGILPEDLNIESLMERINEDTEEVILATDPTVEGETTALYLTRLLDRKTKVSRLAYGISVGSHLDYTDTLTLTKAFEGRTQK
jgi:recombination protein RecR